MAVRVNALIAIKKARAGAKIGGKMTPAVCHTTAHKGDMLCVVLNSKDARSGITVSLSIVG
ncbi:MAG: hypothetical protein WCE82_02380 [Halobacteriota archaeon]